MGSRVQIAPYLVNNISMGVNIGPIPDMFDFVATLAHELIHALENGTTEYVDNAAARTAYSLQTELDAFLFQRLVEDQITANVTFPPTNAVRVGGGADYARVIAPLSDTDVAAINPSQITKTAPSGVFDGYKADVFAGYVDSGVLVAAARLDKHPIIDANGALKYNTLSVFAGGRIFDDYTNQGGDEINHPGQGVQFAEQYTGVSRLGAAVSPVTIRMPDGTGKADHADESSHDAGVWFDPLVIDVAGTGLNLTQRSASSPYYDLTGSGFQNQTAWVSSGTGFLVSIKPDGSINLFTGAAAGNGGFGQLALLDTDGSGSIDANDPGFSSLYVWQDTNSNGIVDLGELQSLATAGIQSLNLSYSVANDALAGNTVVGIGSVMLTDGTTRELADVNLDMSTVYTQSDQTPVIPTDVAKLPQLAGYGSLTNLRGQMSVDPILAGLVQSFVQMVAAGAEVADLRAQVDQILYRWAGVESVDPGSRGGYLDGRRLGFLEHFLGRDLTFPNANYGNINDPGVVPSLAENTAFIGVENGELADLLVQVLPSIANEFTYDQVLDVVVDTALTSTTLSDFQTAYGPITAASLDAWSEVSVVLNAFSVDFGVDLIETAAEISPAGVVGLDVLENAIAQGLAVSVDAAGTLHVSNAAYDGMVTSEYGRFAGLTYVYNTGDGRVAIDFAESANLEINQGPAGVPNTLLLGGSPVDFTVAVEANGDEVFTDGITGDTLTITGQLINDGYVQRGVQKIEFADGTVWTQPHAISYADQTDLTSPYAGVIYDTNGFTGLIEAGGGGNTIIFGTGYGHITASETGHGGTIQMMTGINPADVTYFVDAGTRTLTLSMDGGADTLTILNDDLSYQNQPSFSTVAFADGTTLSLGDDRTVPLVYVVGPTQQVFTVANGFTQVDYQLGDGNALVYPYPPALGARGDIVLGAGITPSDVYLQSDDTGDLFIRFHGDATDSIDIFRSLYANGTGTSSKVADIKFSDGTTLQLGEAPDLSSNTPLVFDYYASGPGAYLVGTVGGSNVFHLAPGGQTVIATNGFSQYDYDLGDGNAVLYARAPWYSGSGVISFGAGITAASAYLTTDLNNNFFIRFRGDDTDSVQIVNELYGNGIGDSGYVSKMLFADGTSEQIGVAPDQSSSNPFTFEYYATATSTTLAGNALGKNIYHLAAGADLVITTIGYGLIDYGLGDGAAVVNTTAPGYGASADISLAAEITEDMVYLQVDNYSDLVVRFRGDPTDSIYLRNDIFNTASGTVSSVSHLLFADGTSMLLGLLPDGSRNSPLTYDWYGSASDTVLAGDRSGSNVYHLAPGNDVVLTTTGYSKTIYSLGDGNATIRPTWAATGSTGDIAFGPGITAADVYFQVQNSHDLVVRFHGDDTDSVTVQSGVYGTALGTITAESNLLFSDGTSMALGLSADGTSYNPITYDWYADASTTTLVGDQSGSNVFHLAPGGDLVITTVGYSKTVFSLGDGNATIHPTAAAYGGSADLAFGPGITAADVYLQTENYDNDLVVRIRGDDTDSVTITGDLYETAAGTVSKEPNLVFSDGTSEQIGLSPDQSSYDPLKFDWYADASTTFLSGSLHGSNEYHLAAGGDTVYTNSTYSLVDFGEGDGNATVHLTPRSSGGSADVSFGAGITAADLRFSDDGNNGLVIKVQGDSTDSITLLGDISADGTQAIASYAKFADGSEELIGTPGTQTFTATAAETTLTGSDDHNSIFMLAAGSDSVTAGMSCASPVSAFLTALQTDVDNRIVYGRGDGNAIVDMRQGFGTLQLSGLNLSDVSFSGTVNDLLMSVTGDAQDSIAFHGTPATGVPGSGAISSVIFQNGQIASAASLLQHAA